MRQSGQHHLSNDRKASFDGHPPDSHLLVY